MSEQMTEKWLKWVALSTAFMAVIAAITTMYMGKYSSRAVLKQGQESDHWAHYQAKSIKGYNNEMQKQLLELQLAAQEREISPGAKRMYAQAMEKYAAEAKRYDAEKKEIAEKAQKLAKEKELSQERGGDLGYSLIFVQISIMLSSLASLTKRKYLWVTAMVSLLGWVFFVLDSVYLFY